VLADSAFAPGLASRLQAAAAAGDAQLLRLTNHALYASPASGLVVRITRSRARWTPFAGGGLTRVRLLDTVRRWWAHPCTPAGHRSPVVGSPAARSPPNDDRPPYWTMVLMFFTQIRKSPDIQA
jgi:hypothetical protein